MTRSLSYYVLNQTARCSSVLYTKAGTECAFGKCGSGVCPRQFYRALFHIGIRAWTPFKACNGRTALVCRGQCPSMRDRVKAALRTQAGESGSLEMKLSDRKQHSHATAAGLNHRSHQRPRSAAQHQIGLYTSLTLRLITLHHRLVFSFPAESLTRPWHHPVRPSALQAFVCAPFVPGTWITSSTYCAFYAYGSICLPLAVSYATWVRGAPVYECRCCLDSVSSFLLGGSVPTRGSSAPGGLRKNIQKKRFFWVFWHQRWDNYRILSTAGPLVNLKIRRWEMVKGGDALGMSQVFQTVSTSSKMSQHRFKKINLFHSMKSWKDPHSQKSRVWQFVAKVLW